MEIKTIKLEVFGRVQGVNFRRSVKEYADENMIKGYVKNLDEGSVEIIAQSNDDILRKLINWIKKNPGLSKVKNVFVEELEQAKIFDEFSIIREGNYLIDKGRGFSNLGKSFLKL